MHLAEILRVGRWIQKTWGSHLARGLTVHAEPGGILEFRDEPVWSVVLRGRSVEQ